MEYFYAPPTNIAGTHLTIDGDEFVHLTHVMRKKPGDRFRVVDGAGNTYDAVLEEVHKRSARCNILARHSMLNEPSMQVKLALGLLKNHARFDFLVEKCTELGVAEITPLLTERTIPAHGKTARWQKLALAAMKQCGRSVLPVVHEPTSFTAFIEQGETASLRVALHEKVESPTLLHATHTHSGSLALCIGPEGGFSEEEIALAIGSGWRVATLGSRRLRTETAAIASLAIVLATPLFAEETN